MNRRVSLGFSVIIHLIASPMACLTLAACSDEFLTFSKAETTSTSSEFYWGDSHVTDLGLYQDDPFSNDPLYAHDGSTLAKLTYSDFQFQLSPDANSAILTAHLSDGTSFKSVARTYIPQSAAANGWQGFGLSSAILADISVTADYLSVATAWRSDGLFGVISQTATASEARFNRYTSTTSWTQPTAMSTLSDSILSKRMSNGRLSDLAFLTSGASLYSSITSTGALTLAYSNSSISTAPLVFTSNETTFEQTQVVPVGNEFLVLAQSSGNLYSLPSSTLISTPFTFVTSAEQISSAAVGTNTTSLSQAFQAATDGNGTVVTVFFQHDPTYVTPAGSSGITPAQNSNIRLFANVRGTNGVWSGPTRVDHANFFSSYNTTFYQNSLKSSNPTGGIDYPSPTVAYIGNGRFLAAFSMIDLTNLKSKIYVRGYTVGTGWDSDTTVFNDSQTISTWGTNDSFRYGNDLKIVSNGQGNATLLVHAQTSPNRIADVATGVTASKGSYVFKVFSYDNGTWTGPVTLTDSQCDNETLNAAYLVASPKRHSCWNLKADAVVFPSGETVIVYPVKTTTGLQLRTIERTP